MKKFAVSVLGFIALGLGAIGIFMPLLPTTPFVLLAAICFSYSSPKFYEWIRRSPYFGVYVENYYTKQGVPMSIKIKSIIFLWGGLALSMILIQSFWVYIVLFIVGIGVTTHLLLIKTKRNEENAGKKVFLTSHTWWLNKKTCRQTAKQRI
jgi:hypothetical protein